MPNYQNGKIYKIVCNITGETYYGSSCQPLSKRVGQHRVGFKRWKNGKFSYVKSFNIIERGDYDYRLVEECPCDSKEKLHARERYWIENNQCINKYIPTRTAKEYYEDNREQKNEYNKEYYEDNKEHIREQKKGYYEQNKEKIKEYIEQNKEKNKEYYEDNKEHIREKQKEYYEDNKEKLAEKHKEKVQCGCGSEFRKDSLSRHLKTKKHLAWVESQ